MNTNVLDINATINSLIPIKGHEDINEISSAPKNYHSKKGIEKYYSYVENKTALYLENVLNKKEQVANYSSSSFNKKDIMKHKQSSSLFEKCGNIFVLSFGFLSVLGSFGFLMAATNKFFQAGDLFGIFTTLFLSFMCLLLSACVGLETYSHIKNFFFSRKTGYDFEIFKNILRQKSQSVAFTDDHIYISYYDFNHKQLKHNKYNYRKIDRIHLNESANGKLYILGTGLNQKKVFNFHCVTNKETKYVFQELEQKISQKSLLSIESQK